MTIFAVWVQPHLTWNGTDHWGGRYIDSQWAQHGKASERQESLKACFKAFGLEHDAWISEMHLADVQITQPAKKKEAA